MKKILILLLLVFIFVGCTKSIPEQKNETEKPFTISITMNDNVSQTILVK